MIKEISFLFFLLLSACGSNMSNTPNSIDPTFEPIYKQFVSDSISHNRDVSGNKGLTIQFAPLEQQTALGEVIGECLGIGYGGGIINIDKTYWSQSDNATHILLIYHELGHCLLNEQHINNPEAIMYPQINGPEQYYSTGWFIQVNQLFENYGDS